MALETAFDANTWTSSLQEALGYLTPFATTLDERDALIELQTSALRLCRPADDKTMREHQLKRFSDAWFTFDEVWSATTDSEGGQISALSPSESLGLLAPRSNGC